MITPEIEQIADFDKPPVVEVALGIQLVGEPIDLEALAALAIELKPEYPHRQQLDPVPRSLETFARGPVTPQVEVRLGHVPLPRTWLVSDDQHYLIQVQADRFILNWRRVDVGDEYPRYAHLRPKFDKLRGRLFAILEDLKQTPIIEQVEVTYVNELIGPDSWEPDRHPLLDGMLTTVKDLDPHGFLPVPEDSAYFARYRIPGPNREPIGRLLVSTEAAYRTAGGVPIYLLKLTTNLAGTFNTDDETVSALDKGREWIVKGFLQLTTQAMQTEWGPST